VPTELLATTSDGQLRWLRFKSAVVLTGLTLGATARHLGVSYNHLRAVIAGDRVGSAQTERRIAGVMGMEREVVFGAEAEREGCCES